MGQCAIEDCEKPERRRGWCSMHYSRWKRHGDPHAVLERRPERLRVPAGQRRCAGCEEIKPLDEFSPGNKRCKDGRSVYCKPCSRERQRSWRSANPEKARANYLRSNERRKPTRWQERMQRDYNLTVEQYEELLSRQGGGCAICGGPRNGAGKRFHIDHDHSCCPRVGSCGRCIRGLLCGSCNTAIGLLNEDPERFAKAADYLSRE